MRTHRFVVPLVACVAAITLSSCEPAGTNLDRAADALKERGFTNPSLIYSDSHKSRYIYDVEAGSCHFTAQLNSGNWTIDLPYPGMNTDYGDKYVNVTILKANAKELGVEACFVPDSRQWFQM